MVEEEISRVVIRVRKGPKALRELLFCDALRGGERGVVEAEPAVEVVFRSAAWIVDPEVVHRTHLQLFHEHADAVRLRQLIGIDAARAVFEPLAAVHKRAVGPRAAADARVGFEDGNRPSRRCMNPVGRGHTRVSRPDHHDARRRLRARKRSRE